MRKPWRLLGSLTLLGVLAWRLDWGRLAGAFAALDARYWLAAVAVYLLAQAVSSLRWQLLAGALGFGGPWRRYLAWYFVGMFFNLFLPTSVGGDVARAWQLAGGRAGRRAPAFLSVLADRLSGLVALVALALVAAFCCPVPLPSWLTGVVAAVAAGTALGLAGLPLAGGRLRPLRDAVAAYRGRPGVLLASLGLSLVVQLANVVLVGLIGRGLGLPVHPTYYGVLVPLVSLATLLPVSLNGVGLRELATALLLALVGVEPAAAVTLSVLQFAAFSAAGLFGGAVYLSGRGQRPGPHEERRYADPVGGDPGQGRARQPPAAA